MPDIPLTPVGGGGLCVSDAGLFPADIIVSTTNSIESGFVRADTNSYVSHAALYDGAGQVYEAIGPGVSHRPLMVAIAGDTLAVTYRVRNMSPSAASAVIAFADAAWKARKQYDLLGAIGAGMHYNPMVCIDVVGIIPCAIGYLGGFKNSDKFYCSQLVLEAYRQAHVSFIDVNPNVSVPQDLVNAYSRHKLMYVGHLFGQAGLRATQAA
jgi:uncharacterized protein YycO